MNNLKKRADTFIKKEWLGLSGAKKVNEIQYKTLHGIFLFFKIKFYCRIIINMTYFFLYLFKNAILQ